MVSFERARLTGVLAVGHQRLRFRIEGAAGALHPGDEVVFEGRFTAPSPRRNPYDFDEEGYFSSRGWLGTVIPHRFAVVHTAHASSMRFIIDSIQDWFVDRIDSLYAGSPNRHLLKALLMGDRSGLDEEVVGAFRRTGLSHILAISGLHVGMVAGLVHFVLGIIIFRLPLGPSGRRWMSTSFSIVLLWLFAALVGVSASVFRASVMVTVFLTSSLLGRSVPLERSLGISAVLLLALRPSDVGSPGFQLSYAAVACICIGKGKDIFSFQHHPVQSLLASALRMTVSAFVGTAPIAGYYFGFVPAAGLLFSPVVVIMVSVLLPLSLVSVLLPFGGYVVAEVVNLGFDWVVGIGFWGSGAHWIPSWKGPIHQISPGLCLLLLAFTLWHVRKDRFFRPMCVTAAAGLSIWSAFSSPASLLITALDVGQGDAIIVEMPTAEALVIDTGPNARSGKAVAGHLKGRALFSGYQIVLTHSHDDHSGGLPFLILETLGDEPSPKTVFHGGWISSTNPATRIVRTGDVIVGSGPVRVFVLGPEEPGADNDHSIILLLQYGESQVLLMGDAESDAERLLTARYGPLLHPDVLKAGHHGSRTSSTPLFLDGLNPAFSVISAGKNNQFGHPHPDVVERLKTHGSRVLETSVSGAIQLRLDKRGVHLDDWR